MNALAIAGSDLYVGGNLTKLGGQTRRVRLPRRSTRLRAVARDAATGETVASSGRLRVFR